MSGPLSGGDSALGEWLRHPRATFRRWREPRPLGGALLMLLGGVIIGYIPAQFASELLLIGGAYTIIGLVFAVAVVFCAIAVLAKPRFSTVFGSLGIAFATLSLFGALGGLLVGMIVATTGGILCYAWEPPAEYETATLAEASGFIWQEAGGFVWQGSRGFVWQTDANRDSDASGTETADDETDDAADDDVTIDLVPDEPDTDADTTADESDTDAEPETGFEFDDEIGTDDRYDL